MAHVLPKVIVVALLGALGLALGTPSAAAITPTPATPSQLISVNQHGYYPYAPKIAALVSDRQVPVEWQLNDGGGQAVLSGSSQVRGRDAASGDSLHWIDFSAYAAPGSGYTLVVEGHTSDAFAIGEALYGELKLESLRYFYLNRSGIALEQQYAGEWARAAGHTSDSELTCHAGTDASGKRWPKCDYTLDGAGGWYDAGDYGKYVVNGGIAVWTLLNAYERSPRAFADGALNIPESGNGLPDILDEVRWELELLLRMQVPAGQPLAGMAHHKLHGLQWDAMPGLPTAQSSSRFLFPPSTAATLNLAATAAQCARVWREIDAAFSARCLAAAEAAWQAAEAHPAMLAAEFPALGGGAYGDGKLADEFYWAAVELYLTTDKQAYRDFYSASGEHLATQGMYWGGTAPLGTLSLALVEQDAAARAAVLRFADDLLATMQQSANGYMSPVPADGYVWGSNSDVLNRAIMLALAYDFSGETRYLDGVTEAMNYLLGRNTLSFSFISGYGARSLTNPHHRFWGNRPKSGYPPPPPGVVAGGPNGSPDDPAARAAGLAGLPPAKSYIDHVESYSTNEVTINWNAPLAWVAAFLDDTARPALSEPRPTATPAAPTAAPSPPATATATPAAPQAQPGLGGGMILGGALALGLIAAAAIVIRRRRP
jgi:endoglucanase